MFIGKRTECIVAACGNIIAGRISLVQELLDNARVDEIIRVYEHDVLTIRLANAAVPRVRGPRVLLVHQPYLSGSFVSLQDLSRAVSGAIVYDDHFVPIPGLLSQNGIDAIA